MIFWNKVLISNLQYGDADLSKTGVILNVNREYLLSRTHRDGGRICQFLMGGERLTIFFSFLTAGFYSSSHILYPSECFLWGTLRKKHGIPVDILFFLNIYIHIFVSSVCVCVCSRITQKPFRVHWKFKLEKIQRVYG